MTPQRRLVRNEQRGTEEHRAVIATFSQLRKRESVFEGTIISTFENSQNVEVCLTRVQKNSGRSSRSNRSTVSLRSKRLTRDNSNFNRSAVLDFPHVTCSGPAEELTATAPGRLAEG